MKKGFIKDLSNEDYHADRTHLSSSVLKKALNDPSEYHRVYVLGEDPKPMNQSSLDFGNYVHTTVLEPHLLDTEYVIYPGTRRGKAWEVFKHANQDKTIITSTQHEKAMDMCENLFKEKFVLGEEKVYGSALFSNGVAEESLFTELNGLPVKVRTDYRVPGDRGIIRDIKTTSSYVATSKDARDVCNSFGYILSAALYLDAVEKETGKPYDFEFIFMSKADKKTYQYRLSNKSRQIGKEQYQQAIEYIKECRKTGKYITTSIPEV